MRRIANPTLGRTVDRLIPLLAADLTEATRAALELAAEIARAPVAGLVLLRKDRELDPSWFGPEGAARTALQEAVRNAAAGSPPSDATGPFHVAIVETMGLLSIAFALAWPEGRPEDLAPRAVERAETIARTVSSRWIRARALIETRGAQAQQERWFKTMDRQLRVLDRERQKFVAVVNQSDTFIFVVDPSLEITWVNRAISRHCESSGGPVASRLEDAWRCLSISAPPVASSACPVTRALRGNEVVHEELRRMHGDEIQHVYVTILPIQGPDAGVAEALVMIQDLSGLEVVRRLEARYRRLFEHSPDGMLMIDPTDGRILLANEAAAALTGRAQGELPDLDAAVLHGEAWPAVRDLCRRALESPRSLSLEAEMTPSPGRAITANLTAVRFDLDGRSAVLVQYRDVTERKRLEAELRHSHKMDAVGTLAGGVAHDFNNLLTVILGRSELLASRLAHDPELGAVVQAIRHSAQRGSLLTRKLLSFSRKDLVRPETLDLVSVVREFLPVLDTLLAERVRLRVDLPEEPCPIRADRSQMEQVLMNLVVNGRDAMPDGGRLRLILRPGADSGELSAGPAADSRRRIVLEVRDEGVGIDEATRPHIFEPFFTTKPRGEGTGLGLSTVYAIVRECGGRIDVTSARGRGSTFRVVLPASDEVRPKPSHVDDPAIGSPAGNESVLLVEDEDDLREMAREALEMGGYSVACAASGEEALRLHEGAQHPFQLLVTDVVMPGISGGELAVRLRALDPDIRVLYMSGYNDDAIVRHGVSRDEAAFLPKPFTLSQLSGKVRELLDEGVA